LVEGPVSVFLDGGVLVIDWDQTINQITMTGTATYAFSGLLFEDMLDG
jgi:diaminopimelate epimerase